MMDGGVLLCYPPVARAQQPYLGLAVLGAVLKDQNVPVDVLDLNLEVWETVWSPEFMAFRADCALRGDVRSVILDLARDVDWAKNAPRSPDLVQDEAKHRQAMTILDAVNGSLSAACSNAFFSFNTIAPREPASSPEQIDGILDDPQRNPFLVLAEFMEWDGCVVR